MTQKELKVSCPKCKKDFHYFDSKYRPFCSKKCKMIDLGLWLSESYSVAGENVKERSDDLEEETDQEE